MPRGSFALSLALTRSPTLDPTAPITSGMDWSSHVKLYTRRPITVHPHAEKREMRRRYELQYLTYARSVLDQKHTG